VFYHFAYGGEANENMNLVVTNGARIALTLLGVEWSDVGSKLVIDDTVWSRIDSHEIATPVLYKGERWNIEFSEISQKNDIEIGSQTISRTVFVAENKSGYSYYEVPLTVVLKRGGRIIGINRTVLSDFMAKEKRDVQVDWFDSVPSATVVDIYPELDVYDESNVIPVSSDGELDIRDVRTRRR